MKIYYPRTRLAELAARPGGLFRDEAIAQAENGIESLRAEADTILETEMAAVAAVIGRSDRLGPEAMGKLLHHAERIVTLAGTFGYEGLDIAARSLCDTAVSLRDRAAAPAAPLHVHLQAMRLLAPGAGSMPATARETVLAELARLTAHLGVAPMPDEPEHAPVLES